MHAPTRRTQVDARDPPILASTAFVATMIVPFALASWGTSVFVAWLLVVAGLLVARRENARAAWIALGAHVLVVLLTVGGVGLTVRRVMSASLDVNALSAAGALLALVVGPGVYLALAARRRAVRLLARVGIAFCLAWGALYILVISRTLGGDGTVVIFLVGALLIAAAVLWRRWLPHPRAAA